jgi:hypothetical protein
VRQRSARQTPRGKSLAGEARTLRAENSGVTMGWEREGWRVYAGRLIHACYRRADRV